MPLGAFKAALMGTAGVTATGDIVLLHDADHSGVSEVDITSKITSTYSEYIFGFYNINPATDDATFSFQVNVAGQSGFNETVTSTAFRASITDQGSASLSYITANDQAQGTAAILLTGGIGNGSDESCAGILHLFNPSNTTYVKHYYSRFNSYETSDYSQDHLNAGYFNVTGAIDEITFKIDSGDFDGTIKMWGVK